MATERPQAQPIRVLFVEDSEDDVELARMELEDAGMLIESAVVDRPEDLRAALRSRQWDVVVSDYFMPTFTGLDALRIVQEFELDMPFILVSGSVGEDTAVEILRAGAHDYLLKDRLTRLPAAIDRELRALRRRKEQRRAERAQTLVLRASAVLASSLDFEQTLPDLARLIAGEVADVCVFELTEPELGQRWVTVAADERRTPPLAELAGRLQRELSSPDAEPPSWRAGVQSKRADLVSHVTASNLSELAPTPPVAELFRELGVRSYVRSRLESGGRVLGQFSLLSVREGHHYDSFDLGLARELSWRAAAAVDNARLYRSAQDAIRLRDDFMAVAAHELRTPITALKLQVRGLRRAATALPPECADPALAERLSRVSRGLSRLTRLVDSLLDVSSIGTGKLKLHPEELDLGRLAADVIEYVEPDAARAGSRLSLVEQGECRGVWDWLRLEQVMMSLLSNALKFGAGHPIEMQIMRQGDRAVLRVVDHGIGVPIEDSERIFRKFERAVPAREYGGLGLGLFVSRQIVEAHGGSIRVLPTPGGGATFEVELPLAPGSSG